MTDKIKQLIKDEIVKLPNEIQNAINVFDWAKITEEIGKKYLLDEEKVNNLQVETFLVLAGSTDPQFFAINIENQVETIKDDAVKMSLEITQKIFTPIDNIIVDNIKKSDKMKNSSPEQTLDFILSGGDYSVFLEQKGSANNQEIEDTVVPVFSIKEENLKRKI